MALLPWLWKKVGDWFFHRYLAHVIAERRLRVLAQRQLPAELKAWSEPVPESHRAQASGTLQSLNQQLQQAYRQGLQFPRMGPVSRWQARRSRTPARGAGMLN